MRTSGDKKATTARLTPATKSKLENVARLRGTSESDLIEKALTEFFKNHNYNTRYVMGANDTCYVLLKQEGDNVTVLDQRVRNGVSLESIREEYVARLDSPVELVVEHPGEK